MFKMLTMGLSLFCVILQIAIGISYYFSNPEWAASLLGILAHLTVVWPIAILGFSWELYLEQRNNAAIKKADAKKMVSIRVKKDDDK